VVSKARLVITAVVVENRPVSEVAAAYGVHRSWIYKLLDRYRTEGEAAFEPRSRRPRSSPSATPPDVVDLVVRLRKDLTGQGLDAGPHTLAWHLEHHHRTRLSPATISRILTRTGQVAPAPSKRPKTSYRRFAADLPNQMWQTDFTHWHLSDRREVEILNIRHDHSRYLPTLSGR
jgi:transposase